MPAVMLIKSKVNGNVIDVLGGSTIADTQSGRPILIIRDEPQVCNRTAPLDLVNPTRTGMLHTLGVLPQLIMKNAKAILWLLIACGSCAVAQTGSPSTHPPKVINTFGLRGAKTLPSSILPGTCAEWATQDTPIVTNTVTCKFLGGNTNKCDRIQGIHAGNYGISPATGGGGNANVPILVNFEVVDFGMTDDPAPIYIFGKVNWGDNSEQSLAPWNINVPLTHVYKTQGNYTIRAFFGKQLHFTSGNWSSSYEGCVDGTSAVSIAP